jgi:hypothetical protein
MPNDASLLFHKFASRENSKVGDAAYLEPCCELLVLVCIDLQHKSVSRHILRRARNLWSGSVTRPAPLRPEVNKNRDARVLDDLVEERRVYLQRLVERWQRSFTGSTTASFGKVICSNTILLTTLFAASDRRH